MNGKRAFPDRFITRTEAESYFAGSRKEFDKAKAEFPKVIIAYPRGNGATQIMYSLYEVQDLVELVKDQKKQLVLTKA